MGVSLCCERSIPGSGESPCSTKSNLPSCLRTHRISRSAATGSVIEHSVQVITTVSILLSASGMRSQNPAATPPGDRPRQPVGARSRATGRRVDTDYGLNLLAIERKVHPRSDPDFEHSSTGRGNHLTAILLKLGLPHDKIENRRQYPAVIDVHDSLSLNQLGASQQFGRWDQLWSCRSHWFDQHHVDVCHCMLRCEAGSCLYQSVPLIRYDAIE